jgi:hypothetical protein
MKKNFIQTLVVLISISILSTSCFKNFYLTNSHKELTSVEAERLNTDSKKFVIVHFSDKTFELAKYTITKQAIEGEINKIEIPAHLVHLNPEENSSNRYKKKYKSAVLNEVHIYTLLKSDTQNSSHIKILSKDIKRIDIYSKDKNRTTVNHILSSFGVDAGILFVLVILVSLTGGVGLTGGIGPI